MTYSNLQPGYPLLLREDNMTPLHWPIAVITEIHKGKDGIVRVVTLRNHKGIFKRLITKICPLKRENDEQRCYCFLGVAECSRMFTKQWTTNNCASAAYKLCVSNTITVFCCKGQIRWL
jgi:hypothetical protein